MRSDGDMVNGVGRWCGLGCLFLVYVNPETTCDLLEKPCERNGNHTEESSGFPCIFYVWSSANNFRIS